MADLPKTIKAASLVDISNLNLSEESAGRVSLKIGEAVLSEVVASAEPPSVAVIGDLSHILKKGWAGLLVPDVELLRDQKISFLNEVKQTTKQK